VDFLSIPAEVPVLSTSTEAPGFTLQEEPCCFPYSSSPEENQKPSLRPIDVTVTMNVVDRAKREVFL